MFHSMDTKSDGNTDDGLDFYFLRGHRGQYVLSFQKRFDYGAYGIPKRHEFTRNLSVDTYIYLEAALLKIAELREQL